MLSSIVSKISRTLLVILGVGSLVFFLLHWVPGDPIEAMLGEFASGADRQALRQALGLNQPLQQQWMNYLIGIFHGDLGHSLYSQRPVSTLIGERLPLTLQLALSGMLVAVILGFPAALIAARYHHKSLDHGVMLAANIGVAVPNFVLGPVLILIFAVLLGWLPIAGRSGLASLVLPALTLGSAMAGIIARMLRAGLLQAMRQDYIRTARAKGLSNSRVLLVHALSNALLPVITLLGLQLAAVLSGTIITERVFSWPGLGSLLIESIERRDYPVVQGCVLVISVIYVVVNMLAEIALEVVDPRLRNRNA